jgi:hypothetical protein
VTRAVIRCVCHDVTYASVSAYLRDHDPEQLSLELDGAAARHPATRLYVGTFEDGSQVLVEQHVPGKLTAATRSASWSVWGPPTFLDESP